MKPKFTELLRFFLSLSAIMAIVTNLAAEESEKLETVPAAYESAAIERIFDGTVEAVHKATVSAQTAGRIAEVGYDVDDFVEAGAVLIRFTDVEQSTALRQAEAQLAEARARQTEAEEAYRRAQNLVERKLGSQKDLDGALAGRDSANARVRSAESAVEAARQQLAYTVVTAPYPGIVTERFVEVGESVVPGQPLMSGLSLDRLRVVTDLPQTVAGEVRKNPQATLITAEGRVEASEITLFPIADPVTNTFRVRLDLPEGQFGLYPGMFVKVVFQTGEAERLMVPSRAVLNRSEVTAVYVVGPNGIRLRQIRTGQRFGDRTEVLAGLSAGEAVAVDPVRAGIIAKSVAGNDSD